MSEELCIQEHYAPHNRCFGCGPSSSRGLRIRSFATGPEADAGLVADWMPQRQHEAFDGMLNGGIIGSLLDCHSNWTAAIHLLRRDGLETPPCTVTAEFHVRMKRPTPSGRPVHLAAKTTSSEGDWVTVEAELSSDGKVTATCTGKFVAVKPGHPAYHRW
jgi:acyl-coenzyme A thioesterase PaaI-like protein